eukprot:jgi/Antlo1/1928/575
MKNPLHETKSEGSRRRIVHIEYGRASETFLGSSEQFFHKYPWRSLCKKDADNV